MAISPAYRRQLRVTVGVVPGRTSLEPSFVVTTHSDAPFRSSMPANHEICSDSMIHSFCRTIRNMDHVLIPVPDHDTETCEIHAMERVPGSTVEDSSRTQLFVHTAHIGI